MLSKKVIMQLVMLNLFNKPYAVYQDKIIEEIGVIKRKKTTKPTYLRGGKSNAFIYAFKYLNIIDLNHISWYFPSL